MANAKFAGVSNSCIFEGAGRMKGEVIETSRKRFASMQGAFETIAADIKSYGVFLTQAADSYDGVNTTETQKAQELGKIF